MKKIIINTMLIFTATMIVVYILIGYAMWDLNILNWSLQIRLLHCIGMIYCISKSFLYYKKAKLTKKIYSNLYTEAELKTAFEDSSSFNNFEEFKDFLIKYNEERT